MAQYPSMGNLQHGQRYVYLQVPTVYAHPLTFLRTRPELCDAIPWFRSAQGGCYYAKGYCWGLLVDADCGTRSYLDEEVIVTRM